MPYRRARRIDSNQPDIVDGLRKHEGVTVEALHSVGGGVPDLLVGYEGKNYLMEVKDPLKTPSAQRLTDDQEKWHSRWKGQVSVVHTVGEALRLLGIDPL